MAKKKSSKMSRSQAAKRALTATESDDDGAIPLTPAEQALLTEILDESQGVVSDVGSRIIAFGRFVLRRVGTKASLATSASGPDAPSALWREVHRRAGGPTLRLSKKTLSIAIRLAAWEQVLNSDNYKGLDYERKVALLPLNDAALIRKAADHVADFRLSLRATLEYVDAVREKKGRAAIRRLTPDRAIGHTRRLKKALGDEKALGRLLEAIPKLDDDKREQLRVEVGEAFALLQRLVEALDG